MSKNETASDEIKDELVGQYRGSKPTDWKRKSKKNAEYYGQSIKRVFTNAAMGIEVVVYEVPEYEANYIHEAGPMIFFAEDISPDDGEEYGLEGGGCFVMFAAETFWNRNHYICDQHQSNFLEEHCGLDLEGFEELSENQFLAHGTAAEIIARLEAKGLRHEPEMKRAGQWEGDGDGYDEDDDGDEETVAVEPGLSVEAAQPGDHKITTAFIVKNLTKRTGIDLWTFDSHLVADAGQLDDRFGDQPRKNNTLFRFRAVKGEGEFHYAIAFAPQGTEGSLLSWDGKEFIPEQGELLFGPASDLFTKQWHRAPEVWTHEKTLGGGLEMYSSPVEYPPYEDGGPVTEEAIIAALHEAFDRPDWSSKPMSSDWTLIPGLGDELRTRYNGKGHMGKLRMYQGKINGVPTKAAVFSPNERDANRLEVCEYDEVVYFGFHDPEDVDGDNIVWAGMRSQVEREGVSDQHQDFALIALNGWPGAEFDEASENYFEDNKGRSRDEIKAYLEGFGFVYKEL